MTTPTFAGAFEDVSIPNWFDTVTKGVVLDGSELGVVEAVKATYGNVTVGTLMAGFHGSYEVNPLRTFIRETLFVESVHGSMIGWGLSLLLATSIISKPDVDTPPSTVRISLEHCYLLCHHACGIYSIHHNRSTALP
jgi:hypothetical protein